MKQFYNIRCDPDLDKSFCDMRHITCACTGCVEQPSNPWWTNLDKTLQPRYDIKPETCNTLPYYVAIINGIYPN